MVSGSHPHNLSITPPVSSESNFRKCTLVLERNFRALSSDVPYDLHHEWEVPVFDLTDRATEELFSS